MRFLATTAMLSHYGRVKLLLALYCTWCIASVSAGQSDLLLADGEALLKIKAALENTARLLSWTNASAVCEWEPNVVICDEKRSRVVQLILQGKLNPPGFGGVLSPYIGNLTELTFLDLSFNAISGPLPPELGRLTKLQFAYLGQNKFYGDIPASFGNLVTCEELTVDHNLLNGTVPDSLGNLTKIRKLDISYNNFNTTLPAGLANARTLSVFYAGTGTFIGPIPDSYGNLINLRILTLDNNNLTGTVPIGLESLCCLQQLRLQNNGLTGYLPAAFAKIPELSYNTQWSPAGFCSRKGAFPDLPKCPKNLYPNLSIADSGMGTNLGLVLGLVFGITGGLLLVLAALVLWLRRHGKLPGSKGHMTSGSIDSRVQCYTVESLKSATNNWTSIIGRGGFGPVYKGKLSNGAVVAIKRLGAQSGQGEREFLTEIDLLGRLHHHSLVNLIGYSMQKKEYLLVYEYKSRGSLDANLRPRDPAMPILTWQMRVDIAVDVAEGLEYLHNGAEPPVIHRDVKSSNVLIDSKYQGSLADFGLGKGSDETHVSTIVKGTPGYMDPEYVLLQQVTFASDVYAYGVVVLELISGQKAYDAFRMNTYTGVSAGQKSPATNLAEAPTAEWLSQTVTTNSSKTRPGFPSPGFLSDQEVPEGKHPMLTKHAAKFLQDPSTLAEFVDPRLEGKFDNEQLEKLAQVASACLQGAAKDRPSMRDICRLLPARSSPWQKPLDSDEGSIVLPMSGGSKDLSNGGEPATASNSAAWSGWMSDGWLRKTMKLAFSEEEPPKLAEEASEAKK